MTSRRATDAAEFRPEAKSHELLSTPTIADVSFVAVRRSTKGLTMSLKIIKSPESLAFSHPDPDGDGDELLPPISFVFEGDEDEIVNELVDWLREYGDGEIRIEGRGQIVVEVRKNWVAVHGLDGDDQYEHHADQAVWCDRMPFFSFGADHVRVWLQTYRKDFKQLVRGGPADYVNNAFIRVWDDNYENTLLAF